jgi:hypothetical protein
LASVSATRVADSNALLVECLAGIAFFELLDNGEYSGQSFLVATIVNPVATILAILSEDSKSHQVADEDY